MDIEIIAVGGYDEVGRNMTAVRCGKEIVIFDMGLRLDQVMIHEDAEIENMHSLDLIKIKAIPDDTMMNGSRGRSRPSSAPTGTSTTSGQSRSWRTGTMRRSSPRRIQQS
jgi:hypothetical protein